MIEQAGDPQNAAFERRNSLIVCDVRGESSPRIASERSYFVWLCAVAIVVAGSDDLAERVGDDPRPYLIPAFINSIVAGARRPRNIHLTWVA